MVYTCYILYSKKIDKYYIGFTHNNLESRILKHNVAEYVGSFTRTTDDWNVFLIIECSSSSQALAIEKHIKKMKSRVYIQNLKLYPEMVEKLKNKYSK